MIPGNCKRLAEEDFPLAAVNAACVEENNRKTRVDSGHIALFHSWWARRPLSACRSLLLTLLLPDPCDPHCPDEFKTAARKILGSSGIGTGVQKDLNDDAGLRQVLFDFVAKIAPWDSVQIAGLLSTARALIQAAYDTEPRVLDPFSGGGSIPLEAQRLDCEVTAADINPVAWLLLKIALEWCTRKGPELAVLFGKWSAWVLKKAEKRLAEYYPADSRGRKPLAYLWARTVKCEASGCGVTIPLIRGLCLSKSNKRKKALRIKYHKGKCEPVFEIFVPQNDNVIESGTVAGMNAACPKCHTVTRRERVQAQLRDKQSGTADAMLFAVVRSNPDGTGKDYYAPTREDIEAFNKAAEKATSVHIEMPSFPQNDTRAFPPGPYGIKTWADVFAPRQKLSRWIIHEVIEDSLKNAARKTTDKELLSALAACLYAAFSDNSQYHTSLCVWLSEGVTSIFIQGSGIPFRADFVESNPLSPNCDGLQYSIRSIQSVLNTLTSNTFKPTVPFLANVLDSILPDESMDVVFTDPPYADQIPYAHLSDFFYGLLRLGLKNRLPQPFTSLETEKARELTENRAVDAGGVHDRQWYEKGMRDAFIRMKQTILKDGIAAFVFAHKETDRWEALVSALVQAGWCVTGSWPIATERRQRMRGQGYAALETSVHLICRPRPEDAPIGDWGVVLNELPKRVGDWMERLQGEGIRGADLVFACIGPALEVFSCYRTVETADGREVPLAEYLVKVWEIVGRSALEQVLGTAEAKARNGAAGALEEDARLTALFLWTLQASSSNKNSLSSGREKDHYDDAIYNAVADDDSGGEKAKKKKGYTLTFDVARRFAQPLGVVLSKWEHRIIEIEKGEVRLLPVTERAKQLFGDEGAKTVSRQLERNPEQILQQSLFPEIDAVSTLRIRGRKKIGIISPGSSMEPEFRKDHQVTTLDRVHAAMLLQAGGQTNGLRTLIKTEQERGPDFLRLSNALSALYPPGSDEKRILDAMLLAIPRKS
jgi:adenine-specific DNA methylase